MQVDRSTLNKLVYCAEAREYKTLDFSKSTTWTTSSVSISLEIHFKTI